MKAVSNLFFATLILLLAGCAVGNRYTNYNKIVLQDVSDYVLKINVISEYLSEFEDDKEELCYNIISDLYVFEMDILDELEQANGITNMQIDTLRDVLTKTVALRKFLQCIGNCEDQPRLTFAELEIAANLMKFSFRAEGNESFCAPIYMLYKERFLFYFIHNNSPRFKKIDYSYRDLDNQLSVGSKDINSGDAALVFSIFNSDFFNRADFKRVKCN